MANEVAYTAADIRPLTGAVVRRAKATEAMDFGTPVYIDSATGSIPNVSKADASAVDALLVCWGIAVAGNPDNLGATSIAAGDQVDVVVHGPVTGYSSMTPGANIWVSDTVGRLSTVVGTKSCIVGIAETAATVFVNPVVVIKST